MYQPTQSREQRELLPPSLEERIAQENPVRVIDAFADTLDLCAMGFTKARPAATGRPAYDPRALLKLYLYGHINGLRSSRRLMRECARNIEVMWLINHYTPDFRTISDFRKENRRAIVGAFQAFVTILREERLLGWEMTVDGTKIRASNSINLGALGSKNHAGDSINRHGADTAGAGAVSAWASGCGAKVLLAAVLSLSWLRLGCRLAMGALACAEK